MIGLVDGFEFWIDRDLFEYWKFSHFTLDVTDGFGPGGFSLETTLGKTFKIIYRLFTEEELKDLEPVKKNGIILIKSLTRILEKLSQFFHFSIG